MAASVERIANLFSREASVPVKEEMHISRTRPIAGRALTDGVNPSRSPDGKHILFSRNGEIWIMRPDGSDQRKLRVGTQPSFALPPSPNQYTAPDFDK